MTQTLPPETEAADAATGPPIDRTSATLHWLDPATLIGHPRNVREDLGDLRGLTASIKAAGVIEPLTVAPIEDGHLIIAGHRRAEAAVKAGVDVVPCIVREDLAAEEDDNAGQARHVGTMLQENLLREGLTAAEEARAVQMMLDLGHSVTKIVKETGLDRKRVIKGAAAARLDDASLSMATENELTLDQLAAVSEFQGHGERIGKLVMAAAQSPGQFAHQLAGIKQEIEREKLLAEMRAQVEADNRTVVETGNHSGTKDRVVSALKWQDGDKDGIDPVEHRQKCEGSAVYIATGGYNGPSMIEVCTAPGKYGHLERWNTSAVPTRKEDLSEEEQEAAKQARRDLIENNKQMEAANSVRRAWLKDYLNNGTKADKRVLRFAIEALGSRAGYLGGWFGGYSAGPVEQVQEALGIRKPESYYSGIKREPTLTDGLVVSDGRLPLQLLAHVAGAVEQTIHRDSWRSAGSGVKAWLRFLDGLGYELSDVETKLIELEETKEAARKEAEDAEEAQTKVRDGVWQGVAGLSEYDADALDQLCEDWETDLDGDPADVVRWVASGAGKEAIGDDWDGDGEALVAGLRLWLADNPEGLDGDDHVDDVDRAEGEALLSAEAFTEDATDEEEAEAVDPLDDEDSGRTHVEVDGVVIASTKHIDITDRIDQPETVTCPACGATGGTCKTPSGKDTKWHRARELAQQAADEAAVSAGDA